MSLYVDIHESIQLYEAIQQLVPEAEFVSTSQNNWSDFYMVRPDGSTCQRENKQWSELMGNLDHIEEQLARCQPSADDCGIIIRGVLTPWSDGQCMVWDRVGNWMKPTGRGWDRETQTPKPYNQSYKGVQTFLARIQDWGFKVHVVDGWRDTANLVAALYYNQDSKTFQRLIKPKPVLTMGVEDERVRKLALQIMGIASGVGEELAIALAETYKTGGLYSLMSDLSSRDWDRAIASIPLRSGRRAVGPAAVANLKKAFGIKEPVSV